ncbi:MAG: hypothetical protein ABJB74_02965 [Gemmatimonas sp.]
MSPLGQEAIVRVRRAEMVYNIPREYADVRQIRAQLDDVARLELGRTLRSSFEALTASDDSLWFVRKVEVAVAVNAAWSRAEIADTWTRHIEAAVQSVVARGAEGESVVRFDDEIHYLQHFLIDVARGTAWSKWFYRRFEGLRVLPASGVIRSVIAQQTAQGLDALVALSMPELALVIETLSPADATRTAQALTSATHVGNSRDAALDALQAVMRRKLPETRIERVALYACIELGRGGQQPDEDFFRLCLALARLKVLSRTLPKYESLLDALKPERLSAVVQLTSVADSELLSILTGASREWLHAAGQRLSNADARAQESGEDAAPRTSSFGGPFLILPFLLAIDIESRVVEWPHCDTTAPHTLLLFLVALAASSGNVPRDWYDVVARDVFGISPTLTAERTRDWCNTIPVAAWRAFSQIDDDAEPPASDLEFLTLPIELVGNDEAALAIVSVASKALRTFASMLPGFSKSSAAHLFVNFLDVQITLQDEPARRIIRRSRPPLDLVLRMAGIGRGTLRLPWDARTLAIFSTDSE